jgi:hypothetical protein
VEGLWHLYSACDHSIPTNSTLYNANPDLSLLQEHSDLSRTVLTSLTMSEPTPTPVEDLPDASAAPTECTYDESLKYVSLRIRCRLRLTIQRVSQMQQTTLLHHPACWSRYRGYHRHLRSCLWAYLVLQTKANSQIQVENERPREARGKEQCRREQCD